MKPFVANETAIIRVYRGKKKIAVKTLTFTPVNNGAAGVATLKVKSGKAGSLAIKVSHQATPAWPTRGRKTVRVDVVRPSAAIRARAARRCASCSPSSPR